MIEGELGCQRQPAPHHPFNTFANVVPKLAGLSAIAMPAEATMKIALRMLFAAMIRERCDGAERSWISA